MVMTLNNLSCYYQKVQNPQRALDYLERSLSFKGADTLSRAGTYLNLSSIKTQLGHHHSAASASRKAIKLLSGQTASPSTLVLAYHSLGVALEATGQQLTALDAFHTGACLAHEAVGRRHELTQQLQRRYFACKKALPSRKLPQLRSSSKASACKSSLASASTARALSTAHKRASSPSLNNKSLLQSFSKGLQTEEPIQRTLKKRPTFLEPSLAQRISSIRNEAALRIQCVWRGRQVRREFKLQKLQLQIAKAEREAEAAISKVHSLQHQHNFLKHQASTDLPSVFPSRRLRILKEVN